MVQNTVAFSDSRVRPLAARQPPTIPHGHHATFGRPRLITLGKGQFACFNWFVAKHSNYNMVSHWDNFHLPCVSYEVCSGSCVEHAPTPDCHSAPCRASSPLILTRQCSLLNGRNRKTVRLFTSVGQRYRAECHVLGAAGHPDEFKLGYAGQMRGRVVRPRSTGLRPHPMQRQHQEEAGPKNQGQRGQCEQPVGTFRRHAVSFHGHLLERTAARLAWRRLQLASVSRGGSIRKLARNAVSKS